VSNTVGNKDLYFLIQESRIFGLIIHHSYYRRYSYYSDKYEVHIKVSSLKGLYSLPQNLK